MKNPIDELIEIVLSGRFGTKNRAELIQRLETLKEPEHEDDGQTLHKLQSLKDSLAKGV